MLGFEAAGFFDDGAKHMRRYRTYSRDALKLTHFPKRFSHPLHFLECFFPLRDRAIMLSVKAQDHPALFFSRQLWEILLAPRFAKNFKSVKLEHPPLSITRFSERFALALRIAPYQQ